MSNKTQQGRPSWEPLPQATKPKGATAVEYEDEMHGSVLNQRRGINAVTADDANTQVDAQRLHYGTVQSESK